MIAITGIGVISAIGDDAGQNAMSLACDTSGVAPVSVLVTRHREFNLGEVRHDNAVLRKMSALDGALPDLRTAMLGIIAAREAVETAALGPEDLDLCAFVNGTTVGGMDNTERNYPSPGCMAYNSCGTVTSVIARHVGLGGITDTISTACSSGANAIACAADMLLTGEIELCVAGATESLSNFHFNGFNSLMIMSAERCRPFSSDRSGINLGEGAAYVVLETVERALRRGVTPLALLAGYGNSCDAFHPTATSETGDGPAQAMGLALAAAGIEPRDISYINAHGTGTPNNDITELRAMRRVFGPSLPPYASTKALTGHSTSAAGALQAVFSVIALNRGFLPGQGFVPLPIEDYPSPLAHSRLQATPRYVLANSFGFGGNDTSLIFKRYENIYQRTDRTGAR